jgi:hypothetical protein
VIVRSRTIIKSKDPKPSDSDTAASGISRQLSKLLEHHTNSSPNFINPLTQTTFFQLKCQRTTSNLQHVFKLRGNGEQ